MAAPNKSQAGDVDRVTVNFSDSIDLGKEEIDWTPKGVRLLTKWYFQEGAEVEFAFDHQGERHCCSGVVVACLPLRAPRGYFVTVLYFVDTPCTELQKAARDCRLAREHHRPSGRAHFIAPDQTENGGSVDGTDRVLMRHRSAHLRR